MKTPTNKVKKVKLKQTTLNKQAELNQATLKHKQVKHKQADLNKQAKINKQSALKQATLKQVKLKQVKISTKQNNKGTRIIRGFGISSFNLIALSEKSINIPKLIAELIHNFQCKLMYSQILELGEDLSFNAQIIGQWYKIIKLEQAISDLIKKYSVHIYIKRNHKLLANNQNNNDLYKNISANRQNNDDLYKNISINYKTNNLENNNDLYTNTNDHYSNKTSCLDKNYVNYVVYATTLNTSMLFGQLFSFFDKYKIPIKSASINTNNYNDNLITLELQLKVSVNLHIMTLRENFLNLCESLNLDSSIELL